MQFEGLLFELVEQRCAGPSRGGVGLGSELMGETVTQDCEFLVQAPDLIFGVGQVGS